MIKLINKLNMSKVKIAIILLIISFCGALFFVFYNNEEVVYECPKAMIINCPLSGKSDNPYCEGEYKKWIRENCDIVFMVDA